MSSKLFIGQIPRLMSEDQLAPLFQQYGTINELIVIRDKLSGTHKGCAFLTYASKEEAEACIAALHNKHTLPGMPNPLQVKYSTSGTGVDRDNDRGERSGGSFRGNTDNKLFIGMIPKSSTTEELMPMFENFGPIDELSILRGPDGNSKGCAFLRYTNRESAVQCITALNGAMKLPGAPSNLVVKFAESEREKQRNMQQKNAVSQTQQMQQLQQLQLLANLAPLLSQQLYAPNAWDPYSQLGGQAQQQQPYQQQASTTAANGLYSAYPFLGSGGTQFGQTPVTATGSTREGPTGANLFVYQLPSEYTDVDLYQTFSSFGNILSAKVHMDKDTNLSKCFGTVSYDAAEAAQVAISQMDGFNIHGKRIKVQLKMNARTAARPY